MIDFGVGLAIVTALGLVVAACMGLKYLYHRNTELCDAVILLSVVVGLSIIVTTKLGKCAREYYTEQYQKETH